MHIPDAMGKTPLHIAAIFAHQKVVIALLKSGANQSIQDKKGLTALHWAAREGNTEVARRLILAGSNPNWQNLGQSTPLCDAIIHRNHETAEIIKENGGHPECCDMLLNKAQESREIPVLPSFLIALSMMTNLRDGIGNTFNQADFAIQPKKAPKICQPMFFDPQELE